MYFLYSRHLKQTSAILTEHPAPMLGEFPPYKADSAYHFRSTTFNTDFQLSLDLTASTQPRLHQSDVTTLGFELQASEAKLQRCRRNPSNEGGAVLAQNPIFSGWNSSSTSSSTGCPVLVMKILQVTVILSISSGGSVATLIVLGCYFVYCQWLHGPRPVLPALKESLWVT